MLTPLRCVAIAAIDTVSALIILPPCHYCCRAIFTPLRYAFHDVATLPMRGAIFAGATPADIYAAIHAITADAMMMIFRRFRR